MELIFDTPATTLEGLRAVARALVAWSPELVREGPGDKGPILTHALLRDLIGDYSPALMRQEVEA